MTSVDFFCIAFEAAEEQPALAAGILFAIIDFFAGLVA